MIENGARLHQPAIEWCPTQDAVGCRKSDNERAFEDASDPGSGHRLWGLDLGLWILDLGLIFRDSCFGKGRHFIQQANSGLDKSHPQRRAGSFAEAQVKVQ